MPDLSIMRHTAPSEELEAADEHAAFEPLEKRRSPDDR